MRKFVVSALLVAAGALPLVAADTYQVDVTHSSALFSVSHLGISNTHGRFNDIAGTLTWDAANPTKSEIAIAIKTESVDTNVDKRDQHLRGTDFFNCKQFPEMTFVSTSFTTTDGKAFTVVGNLTLAGTTKPVTLAVTKIGEGKDPWGGYRIGFTTDFSIKRGDFGIAGVPGIGEDVAVTFAFEGIKK